MAPILLGTLASRATRMGVVAVLGLVAGLAMSSPAHAKDPAEPRYKQRRKREVVVGSAEYQQAAETKRMESIAFLKELLSYGNPTGDRKAEMLMRLADLYYQQGIATGINEMESYQAKYDACFEQEGCDPDALAVDTRKSTDWKQKATSTYEQILAEHPTYARIDEVLFYAGVAHQDLGHREKALGYYEQLVQNHQDSTYIPDAYVAIGEYYFDTNNAAKALDAYTAATNYPQSDTYSFARYKQAWSYYNVGEQQQAITTMQQVVSHAQTPGASDRIQLQEEALRDLVRFFADVDELDRAYAYFNKMGKQELIESLLERLASAYFEQGKFEQSAATYRRLIAENPQNPKNPAYQVWIVKAYDKLSQPKNKIAELERLRATYHRDSEWASAQANNPEALTKAETTLEKTLRESALTFHNQAKELGSGKAADQRYAWADALYAMYLQEFPTSEQAYGVRYAYGELLYHLGNYEDAYTQYMAVVAIDPQGEHSRFCAESAIFAADERVKAEAKASPGKATTPTQGTPEPEPLTTWETHLVNACRQYAELYPSDAKVKNVLYRSAYLLYNKNRFQQAGEQLQAVIKLDPSSNEAMQAANLLLGALVQTNDLVNLKANAKFYYDQPNLGNAAFKAKMYQVYQQASIQGIASTFQDDGNHAKAADAYLAFYDEFKGTAEPAVLAKALNNAAFHYTEASDLAAATAVRLVLVDDAIWKGALAELPGGWVYTFEPLAALGYAYESAADFSNAALYYETLYAAYPNTLARVQQTNEHPDYAAKMPKIAADALFSAAVFRSALGDYDAAIANYRGFLDTFPTDPRAGDVRLSLANTYEAAGQWNNAASEYQRFYSSTETTPAYAMFARLHHGKALEQQGQQDQAFAVYQAAVDSYTQAQGAESMADYVAEMMFRLAEPAYQRFAAQRITSLGSGRGQVAEDRNMKAQLVRKGEALSTLGATYTNIINTGSGVWGIAALVQLGKAQENMAETLLTAETPYYLSADQAELYHMGLQDMAYPRTERAIAWYDQALQTSHELTLYDPSAAIALTRLRALRPEAYPPLAEDLPQTVYTASNEPAFSYETTGPQPAPVEP